MGANFGWIFACHQIGASLAAFGAGAVRTWLGDYLGALLASGLLCMFAVGPVLRIGHRVHDANKVVYTHDIN
jgi:hypothetical protein